MSFAPRKWNRQIRKPPHMHSYLKNIEFTSREKELIIQIRQGKNAKEIGESLNLSSRTIDKYRRLLLMKTLSRNCAHLVHQAYQFKWA